MVKVVSCRGFDLRSFDDTGEADGITFLREEDSYRDDAPTYDYPLPAQIKRVKPRGKKVPVNRVSK